MSVAALRILHVVPYYEHAWAYGGIPRLATTMTRALARRGHASRSARRTSRDAHSRTAPSRESATVSTFACFRNLSNRLAYHLQFFTPIGLRAYLRTAAATVRRRAPARLPQPARRHCGSGVDACRRAVCRFAERHGAADRTADPGEARVRGDRREARAQPARRGCLRSRDVERAAARGAWRPAHRASPSSPTRSRMRVVADADAAGFAARTTSVIAVSSSSSAS